MSLKRKVNHSHKPMRGLNGAVYHFDKWTDHQGVHYRCTDASGVTMVEKVNLHLEISWVDWVSRIMQDIDR